MNDDCSAYDGEVELRPTIGLTRGLPKPDLESLVVDALIEHRALSAQADKLFHDLPEEIRSGRSAGGAEHLKYIKAMLAMHCQMAALSSLLSILGYIPAVAKN
ncbi:transcriptional repressor TraM [Shinella sumterensis]|uniref:transcriptional repressor TraM n=1 Tax=Shinella sumterensis TaxID=1967501 RepID=UPI003F874C51